MMKIPKIKLNKGIIIVILIGLLIVIGVVIVSAMGRGTLPGKLGLNSYKTTCEVTIFNSFWTKPSLSNVVCHQEKVLVCTANPMSFLLWGSQRGQVYMSIGGESQEIPFEVEETRSASKRIVVCHKTPDNTVLIRLFSEEGDTVYDERMVTVIGATTNGKTSFFERLFG